MDQVIPLTNAPNQKLAVALSINGQTIRLNLTIRYNEMANYWVLTIADANNNVLVDSVPLITGTWPAANVLAQYDYLQIGSLFVVNVSNSYIFDYPNADELGTDFVLVWSDNYDPEYALTAETVLNPPTQFIIGRVFTL